VIYVQIFENKQYVSIFLPSIANLKCTSSDRQMYPHGYMCPRLGTPELKQFHQKGSSTFTEYDDAITRATRSP